MFRSLSTALVLFCFLVPGTAPTQGASPEAKALFSSGIQAFNNGDLEKARRYLEAAGEQGLTTRSLIYNLGVVYYRLELYDQADKTFRQLLTTSQKALALYNIGLIALAREDKEGALDAFTQVLDADPKQNLETLASKQLERLGARTSPKPDRTRWIGLLSMAGGYEDNIALFPDSAPARLDSGFIETLAAASGYVHGDGSAGVRSDLKLFARQYPSEHAFDLNIAQADASWVQQISPGQISAGIGGDYIWRDRRSRERRARLVAGFRNRHCLGVLAGSQCTVKAEVMQVLPEKDYDAYRGQLYRLDMRYQARQGDWKAELRYRAEYNNRNNLDRGEEFFSVSPERHGLNTALSYAATARLSVEAGAGFRFSYYRHPHQLRIPDGTLIIRREDKRYDLSLAASYKAFENTSVTLDLDHTANHSNIDRYKYDRQSITLGVAIRL